MVRKKKGVFDIVNTIIMLIMIFVTVYPFVYMISVSLSDKIYVMQDAVTFYPKGFTLEWYETVCTDPRIGTGYRNTIFYTIVGTTISLLVTSMGAFALSQPKMICRRGFGFAIVFTILFSGGMIPSYLIYREIGITNTIWGYILPGVVSAYNLLVFRSFLEELPQELFESGRIDGMNDIGLFFWIAVPLSKAVYAAIGLFVAVGIWNNYYNALLYLQDENLFPLQTVLHDLVIAGALSSEHMAGGTSSSEDTIVLSLKYATIMVSTIPILCVYPFLQKYFVKGVLLGSVKG